MTFSNELENDLLNAAFGSVSYTPATTHYIGLSTANPTDDASGNAEPSTGAYARVTFTNNTTNWGAAGSSSERSNAVAITFPESTAAWSGGSNLTYFTIWDHATNTAAANLVAYGALDTARSVDAAGITLSFAIGALDITLD